MDYVTTFPNTAECQKAQAVLERLALPHQLWSPGPGYARVGVPALALTADARTALMAAAGTTVTFSGWVDYRKPEIAVPAEAPRAFADDCMGETAMMVLAPCVADSTKIRLIAHTAGDLSQVFPYLNTEMRQGCFNPHAAIFTYMDAYRMISLYPHRIAIAKADEIVDGWRTLEKIRCLLNDIWARRDTITPSYEMRRKPPALEIFLRLPGTSCRQCGEKTCMAFALKLWSGDTVPAKCKPVFAGEFGHLQPALVQICAGLGVGETNETEKGT